MKLAAQDVPSMPVDEHVCPRCDGRVSGMRVDERFASNVGVWKRLSREKSSDWESCCNRIHGQRSPQQHVDGKLEWATLPRIRLELF